MNKYGWHKRYHEKMSVYHTKSLLTQDVFLDGMIKRLRRQMDKIRISYKKYHEKMNVYANKIPVNWHKTFFEGWFNVFWALWTYVNWTLK